MSSVELRQYEIHASSEVEKITETVYYRIFQEYEPETIQLIYSQDTLIGWAHLHIPEYSFHSGFVFIYINPKDRRKGIGTFVYRKLEECLKKFGGNWWSSYPESEAADRFALQVGFDYTNMNSYLVHDGRSVVCDETGIRQARSEDYPTAPNIWGKEYAAMHKRLGLPTEEMEMNEEQRKEDYQFFLEILEDYYVLEVDGKIVGMGTLFDDDSGIGALAVDSKYAGKGYGTKIAAYLTNECKKRGCANPCIYCETQNDNAMHLYQKIGYVEKKRESVAIKN